MNVHIHPTSTEATVVAADWLAGRLVNAATRNVMLAGGNTPLALYAEIARRKLALGHLHVFALDEYVGVPKEEPRNCANLIRRTAIEPWGVPGEQFHPVSSLAAEAADAIRRHEAFIRQSGGLDLVVLGLGRNGHIGFNEPGSAPDSEGRVLALSPTSIAANREWFGGNYAPDHGVTTGMKLLLEAKSILLLAFGPAKQQAVQAMWHGPQTIECPASYLQRHPGVEVWVDEEAVQ